MADDKAPDKPTTPVLPDPSVPPVVVPKAPLCPTCKKEVLVYEGTNPSKVGTGFCTACGVRQPLKG